MADVTLDGYQINLLGGYAAEYASEYSPSHPKPSECILPLTPYTPIIPPTINPTIPDCKTVFPEIPLPNPYIAIPCIPILKTNLAISGATGAFTVTPAQVDIDGHPCEYDLNLALVIPSPEISCPALCGVLEQYVVSDEIEEEDCRGIYCVKTYVLGGCPSYSFQLKLGTLGEGYWEEITYCNTDGEPVTKYFWVHDDPVSPKDCPYTGCGYCVGPDQVVCVP